MAITETRQLPAQFIEDLGTDYAKQLTAATAASQALPVAKYAPQVAPQTALQQQATTLAGSGIGAYQPYVAAAGTAATAAGTGLGAAQTGLTGAGTELTGAGTALGQAGTTLGGVPSYISAAGTGLGTAAGLTGTGAGTGTGSIASYMSPYQSQVIDTSLQEFDRQAAARQQQISDAAVAIGGYGGGREGVMQAEYQTQSDRNRAALQAQLQQQGFGQFQLGAGQTLQNFQGTDIQRAGQVGAADQAFAQAGLDATRELERMKAYEPLERLGIFSQGVTGLMGGYPAQYQFTQQPNASPLAQALGIGASLGGLYGKIG